MWFLAKTTEQGWRPGIGDPTLMGWFTVAAYLIAAALCYRAHRAARGRLHRGHRTATRLWLVLAIVFALLAVNKQLDLQSLFTAVGRWVARRGGWYQQRQSIQTIFIVSLALLGFAAIFWLAWIVRGGWREYGLALAGATFIMVFVIIRAASFHHVDQLLGWELAGVRINWLFELGGIACVAVSAWRNGKPRMDDAQVRRRPAPERPAPRDGAMNQRESFQWMVERLRDRSRSSSSPPRREKK